MDRKSSIPPMRRVDHSSTELGLTAGRVDSCPPGSAITRNRTGPPTAGRSPSMSGAEADFRWQFLTSTQVRLGWSSRRVEIRFGGPIRGILFFPEAPGFFYLIL